MADTFTCAVNTGPLFDLARATGEASARCAQLTGTVYANALRTLTPPHGDGATLASTARKNSKGITKLRERIAEDIMGGPTPTFARPVRRYDGNWMAFDSSGHYTEGNGNFGLVVPTVKKFGKAAVPMEDPARIIKDGYFRRRRGAMRRIRQKHDGPHFVTASALRALVRRKQKLAGYSISGWAHGARLFSTAKNIPGGFFASLGGAGDAGLWDGPSSFVPGTVDAREGWLENDAIHDAKHKSRFVDHTVYSVARHALDKMRKNIISWYTKKAKQILNS